MNACVRAVVRYGISKGLNVYGVYGGYTGLIEGKIKLLDERSVGNIIQTGGTILKTSRCPEFKLKEGRDKAIKNMKKHGIQGLIVVGGDGTFRGAKELIREGIICACVPATIDNNLSGLTSASLTQMQWINQQYQDVANKMYDYAQNANKVNSEMSAVKGYYVDGNGNAILNDQ